MKYKPANLVPIGLGTGCYKSFQSNVDHSYVLFENYADLFLQKVFTDMILQEYLTISSILVYRLFLMMLCTLDIAYRSGRWLACISNKS